LVIITNSPSCCSYHEIYISTLPSLTLNLTLQNLKPGQSRSQAVTLAWPGLA
jgi:hypothetical protein